MRTSFLLPMMFISLQIHAETGILSVEEAVKKKLIKLQVYYYRERPGEVMRMKIVNLQPQPLSLSVEAGRRLDSKDSTEQDILVTRAVTVQLLARETKTVPVSGMCCQAFNGGSDSGSGFRIGTMADSSLVKLACYINENKWYDNSIAQHAVWIVSDNKPMESIGGEDSVSRKLQRFVSKLTGRPIPVYKMAYSDVSGTENQSVPAEISGTFAYDMYSNGVATFGVYDAEGHVVQMFFTERLRSKGNYQFTYSFKTSGLPKGNYYARLRVDGQVKKEQVFTF